MSKRPVSITVISVLLALNAILSLLGLLMLIASQGSEPPTNSFTETWTPGTMDYVLGFIDVGVFFVSAAGLFLRQDWTRFLLIAWAAVFLLHGLLSQHIASYAVMRELMFVGVISIFLFSAKANAWFAKTADGPSAGS